MTSPECGAIDEIQALLGEYEQYLSGKANGTTALYLRSVRHLIAWLAQCPGNEGHFQPQQLTKTAVELYLAHLDQQGLSLHYRTQVKSTISNFAHFLIEEKELLHRNPTRGIDLPPVMVLPPRHLSQDQRAILLSLVKRAGDRRGSALFALGYWAGCRVSDVSWLQMAHTHMDAEGGWGWLHVGYKESKGRDIDLVNEAHQALYAYLQATEDTERPFVFTTRRNKRLTEEGIHYWFRVLKAQATKNQWYSIQDLTYHDLRCDFACRAREAGWSLEEVAYYLGQVTEKGVPAIQTTSYSTQVSREQVAQKLKDIKG
jgi:site-specific recombinase XerC